MAGLPVQKIDIALGSNSPITLTLVKYQGKRHYYKVDRRFRRKIQPQALHDLYKSLGEHLSRIETSMLELP